MFSSVTKKRETSSPTDGPTRVAVIEDDAVTLHHLVEALKEEEGVHPFLSLDDLLQDREVVLDGMVLVLGPSQLDEVVLDRTNALLHTKPSLGALLVVEEVDSSVLRIALRSGLDDAVALSRVEEDLPQAVRDLGFRLSSLKASAPAPTAADGRGRRGRVTTVFSPKGGVGKSVVALNLATALAQHDSATVALVDLDVNFGDISVMLRLKPAHHVGEAAAAGSRLDTVLMESLLFHDERTGVAVLAAPPGGGGNERFAPESVADILSTIRTIADHVIVDTPAGLDENVLQALSESDDIVFVVGMDVPSVKNARLGLQALELVGVPLNRIVVALNRADSRVHLDHRDIERALQMKVDVCLPSDSLVPQSVNTGAPAVLEFGRSRFAGRIREIASLIAERAAESEDR